MLARPDSPPPRSLSPAFPAWARTGLAPEADEAAFLAGAGLARLDLLIRENPPWAGAFRRRLALCAAVATVASSGRCEDEAVLRDALHLTRPGGDPGPAGRHGLAWRALTSVSAGQWRSAIAVAAGHFGTPDVEALRVVTEAAEACIASPRTAPFAAARAYFLAKRELAPIAGRTGEGELLAAWLADAVLAQKLGWPISSPLLAESLFSQPRRRIAAEADEGAQTSRVLFAYARAAENACDLAADLSRRARRLAEVAPKLRAKGAGAALDALLDEDSLSATTKIPGLSERGARRLFDRLVELGAIRELTGRPSFRLYGL